MHPTPTGTRDVLPDELRELRTITAALRGVYERHGYGEVRTPAIEHDEVLRRGETGLAPGYRVFDDHGNVMALRPDMTVPIARLAATRYAHAEPPLRFSYLAHVYRGVRPHRGEARELHQSGIELLGAGAPDGTVEVVGVLCEALDAAGLEGYRIALGSASVYPRLLEWLGAPEEARPLLRRALADGDFVRLNEEVTARRLDRRLLELPQLRGDASVLDQLPRDVAKGLWDVLDGVSSQVRERIVVDVGLARNLGYYTGAVFDVLHPALGAALGGGGRYDELCGRFGRPLPAAGFALQIDALHQALTMQERAR